MELVGEVNDPLLPDEAADGHGLVPLVHPGDGVGQVVSLVVGRRLLLGSLHADPLARRAGQPADAFEHGVQDSPGEVRLGVGQEGGVVGPGSAAQGQVALAL